MKTRHYEVVGQKTALIQFIYKIFPIDSPFRDNYNIEITVITVEGKKRVSIHFEITFGEAQEEKAYAIVDHEGGISFIPETEKLRIDYERGVKTNL